MTSTTTIIRNTPAQERVCMCEFHLLSADQRHPHTIRWGVVVWGWRDE